MATLTNNTNPIGAIISHGEATPPAGFLICDGSAVSRTTYANLFNAIGLQWGAGDGSTTFNLPDTRGFFLRGLNRGSGGDPDVYSRNALYPGGNTGDNVGSYQLDQYYAHYHSLTLGEFWGDQPRGSNGFSADDGYTGTRTNYTTVDGGNETRPINAAVLYCVKY